MEYIELPTNYKDDVLNKSENGKRRYEVISNDDGTVSFNDVTNYDVVGDDIKAEQINAQNRAINSLGKQIELNGLNVFEYRPARRTYKAREVLQYVEDITEFMSGYELIGMIGFNSNAANLFPYTVQAVKNGPYPLTLYINLREMMGTTGSANPVVYILGVAKKEQDQEIVE